MPHVLGRFFCLLLPQEENICHAMLFLIRHYTVGMKMDLMWLLFFFFHMCAAHQGRVMVVLFVLEMEWLLSTGQDKNFTWHCSESSQQLGTYRTAAWVSGLQYPSMVCLPSIFFFFSPPGFWPYMLKGVER